MNRDEIFRMVQEAYDRGQSDLMEACKEAAAQAIAVAVAEEREACAKVCEDMRPSEPTFDRRFFVACTLNANAIRARGQA